MDESDIVIHPVGSEAGDRVRTQEQISTLAYEYYLERGGKNGNALDDWLAAEREILRRAGNTRQS